MTGHTGTAHGSARPRARARRRRTTMILLASMAAALVLDLDHDGGGRERVIASITPLLAAESTGASEPPAGHAAASPQSAAGDRAAGDRPAGEQTPVAAPHPVAKPFPTDGPGTFGYAAGPGPVLGTAGTLRRFLVAVEDGMGQDPAEFATAVDVVLGDGRSWIAGGELRLQRVPRAAEAQFTIFLATPGTSARMCAEAGLDTGRYTSCRTSGRVIINVARWMEAVPGYGAPLAEYRAYAINHEVGHELGYPHEACPGAGRPAPVMQQQTLDLAGCRPNGWPFLDGRRYSGPAVP